MIKVVLLPKDEYFEQNVAQLRCSKSIEHIDVVIVTGHARTCKDARVLTRGWFGYTPRIGPGEFRVPLSDIIRVVFYLEM